jgi:Fe-S cluster assembly iron-binding protein IscA
MLEVTNKAAALLKAAKAAQGAPEDAGIRIRRAAIADGRNAIAVGFSVSDEPQSGDDAFERHGLRIFVEDALVEPLDGHTLDVSDGGEMPELVFR